MAIDNHGFTPEKNIYNLTSILQRLDDLENAGRSLSFDKIYPVGSIYITTSNTNPGTYFEGTTWERYAKGQTIFGQIDGDSAFTPNNTGGNKKISVKPDGTIGKTALSTSQVPRHNHMQSAHRHGIIFTGTHGSANDKYIYQDFNGDRPGGSPVNLLIPYNDGTAHYGSLCVWNALDSQSVSNYMKTDSSGGGVGTDYAFGNNSGQTDGHGHSFSGKSTDYNILPPYVTCYIWRRKS